MEVQLRRLGPNFKIKVLKVPEQCNTRVWLAGRGTGCHIYTKSKYASRKHFSITYKEKNYFISDLQSANGTFVNDKKVTGEVMLTLGNIISVGVPSSMQNVADCVIFVFELHSDIGSGPLPLSCTQQKNEDEDIFIVKESLTKFQMKKEDGISSAGTELLNVDKQIDLDHSLIEITNDSDLGLKTILDTKNENSDCEKTVLSSFSNNKKPFGIVTIESSSKSSECVATSRDESKEENCRILLGEESIVKNVTVACTQHNSSSEKCAEASGEKENSAELSEKSKTGEENQIQISNTTKLNLKQSKISLNCSDHIKRENGIDFNEDNSVHQDIDDVKAYEASTQVDETSAADYSMTEELIEIGDSEEEEEEWSSQLKKVKLKPSEEVDEEDDDDVIFLEKIAKPSDAENSHYLLPNICKVENDLTETDKKWMVKLLKIKEESDFCEIENLSQTLYGERGRDENEDEGSRGENEDEDVIILDEPVSTTNESGASTSDFKNKFGIRDCVVKLFKLPDDHVAFEQKFEKSKPDETPSEPVKDKSKCAVQKENKKELVVSKKKSVTFDLVPKIRYFEIPVKLSPVEKGRLRFANIIYNICNWNTRWLEECRTVSREKDPPDLSSEPLKNIPKKFDSHAEYMSAFVPVMLLYVWNKIKDNWIEFGDSAFRQTVSCDSQEDYPARNLHVYQCTGLVQNIEAHKQLLREGYLVLLRIHQSRDAPSEKYSKKLGYLVFGFVERKSYERFELHRTQVHSALRDKCLAIGGPLHLVRLTILVKKRPDFKIDKNELIQVTVIQNISSEIRMFRGICFLPESPLCQAILNPLKYTFLLRAPPKEMGISFKGPLDKYQREIVSKMTYACLTTTHFIYSIHGAAGTGKGQVIIAFILQLLYGKEFKDCKRPKIIYCTPSSVPLDAIVSRLKICRQDIDESSRFSLVRVGQIKEIKPEVRDVALSNLAKNRCSKEVVIGSKRKMSPDSSKLEGQILEEADVVCTTCSSSGMTKMISAFKKSLSRNGNRRIICILDEAMQSKESESVLPLLLGVTHLFLVGDVYQLDPPPSGERTRLLGLDMSLFWRICQNFVKTPKELSPFYVLKVQHRMNPSIARFPTTAFYQYHMENSEKNSMQMISNLRNYLFLVDLSLEESVEKEHREGRMVLQLIKTITKITRSASKVVDISIITCDLRQNDSIQFFIPKSKFPEVEINQVHRFQGRESDVVLFAYDGSKIPNAHVTVALTRAKCSLFILTSQKSINNNAWFQKLKADAESRHVLKHVQSKMTPDSLEPILTV